jgi:hypothetical protein
MSNMNTKASGGWVTPDPHPPGDPNPATTPRRPTVSVNDWLRDQRDREANGENAVERQLWPRGRYREGWNLDANAAFSVHKWALGIEWEKDVNDFALGVEVGPFWLGLHGFKVEVSR